MQVAHVYLNLDHEYIASKKRDLLIMGDQKITRWETRISVQG